MCHSTGIEIIRATLTYMRKKTGFQHRTIIKQSKGPWQATATDIMPRYGGKKKRKED